MQQRDGMAFWIQRRVIKSSACVNKDACKFVDLDVCFSHLLSPLQGDLDGTQVPVMAMVHLSDRPVHRGLRSVPHVPARASRVLSP